MVRLNRKNCSVDGCTHIGRFGTDAERYCRNHKTEDMKLLDAVECCYENCTEIAEYNYRYLTKPRYCKEHRFIEMIVLYPVDKSRKRKRDTLKWHMYEY